MFVQMVLWYHGGAFLDALQREGYENASRANFAGMAWASDVSLLLSVT